MTYSKPVVGPKAYVSVGASGWPEVFKRPLADGALQKLLGDIEIDTVADGLVQECRGLGEPIEWHNVKRYLSEATGFPQDAISTLAGISLWAHALTFQKYT